MIGPQDLWVALGLMVFFFGAKKLPELSRSLGQALAQFKQGLAESNDEARASDAVTPRSVEHTSELQSRLHLVCRLLLEKKKTNQLIRGSREQTVNRQR